MQRISIKDMHRSFVNRIVNRKKYCFANTDHVGYEPFHDQRNAYPGSLLTTRL